MIDAHVHLWRLGSHDCRWPTAADGILHRDFELAELEGVLAEAGVGQAILVQSQESPRDTAWLCETAARSARIAGVVGWADPRDVASVDRLGSMPECVGLRPMVQDRIDDWYDDPALDAGFAAMAQADLVLDALVRPRHLASLARLARRHPGMRIVIDHAAKPEGVAGVDAWRERIAPLAPFANVAVKVSGLLTELPVIAVGPVIETLIALFGNERLIWGSDWPVLTAGHDYAAWLDLARALVATRDHAAVFGGNAARIYRIEAAGHA